MSLINRCLVNRIRFWIISIVITNCFATPTFALMNPNIQSPVPDTGQTQEYSTTFGQDSHYNINPTSFTKLDASGNPLSDSAANWAMVKDNVTGLIWEIKQANDGIANYDNIHDADNTYTWYDLNSDTNGGVVGTSGDKSDTLDFINAMNTEKLGGFADWRIPTKQELNSIVNFGAYNPAVNTLYFANTVASYYWTANSVAAYPDHAWKIDFYSGTHSYHSKLDGVSYHVRAVRGGQSRIYSSLVTNGNFIVNSDNQTVIDVNTGLMWQKLSSEDSMGWEDALIYAENLVFADYSDWRLPTIKELDSIVAMDRFYPAIDTNVFDIQEYRYWSGTTYVESTENGWVLDFVNYGQADNVIKTDTGYVRCVRQSELASPLTSIEFVSNSFTAGEPDGFANITVRRVGDTTNAVSVECITYGGTAIKDSDFNINSTLITWAAREGGDKTFSIPIINDTIDEANETVHLYLINPTGGASIGAPAGAVLSITDDDNQLPPTNRENTISGTLYEEDGSTPITGTSISVSLYRQDICGGKEWVKSVSTNTLDGTYIFIEVSPGTYYVKADPYNANYLKEWWAQDSSQIEQNSAQSLIMNIGGSFTKINFQLDRGSTISGKLYESDGITPIPIANLHLEVISGEPCGQFKLSTYSVNIDATNSSYTINGVPQGQYYIRAVHYNNSDYIDGWWALSGSSVSCDAAQPIVVSTGQNYLDKNFRFERGGKVSGTVYNNDGTAIVTTPIIVEVWSGDPCGNRMYIKNSNTNISDGTYSVNGLPSGTYYIKTYSYNSKDGDNTNDQFYINEWWNSQGGNYQCSSAETISIVGQEEISNKNFQIDIGGLISGTIFGEGGEPLICDSSYVQVFSGEPCGIYQPINNVNVDNHTGNYVIKGVPTNTIIYLSAWSSSHNKTVWWSSKGSSAACTGTESLNLTTGQSLSNINFQMNAIAPQYGAITVTILPLEAVNAGGLWRVDGGAWQHSGVTISNLNVGEHTVDFHDISGWTTPASQSVTIQEGGNSISGYYNLLPVDDGSTPPQPPVDNEPTTPPVNPDDSKPKEVSDIKDINDSVNTIDSASEATMITGRLTDDINIIQENIPEDNITPSNELVEAINTTIVNVGNIVEKSFELFKNGKIEVEQALKPLELLDDIIDLGAKTAKSGGAISTEKVSKSIESVEGVIDEAISKGVTDLQMKSSSVNINNMLGNMPDIMRTLLNTLDVIKFLEPIKNLTSAGIKSAVTGKNEPSKTVDALGPIVVKGLQKASEADIVVDTGKIINSAEGIINNTVKVLQTATTDTSIVNNTLEQLQIELSEMVGQTAFNVKDKFVGNNQFASNTFAATPSNTYKLSDFVYLMDNVSGLTTSIIKAKSAINSKLSGTMQSLSRETMKNILPAFVSGISANRLAAAQNDSDIQKLLKDYPQLLNEVINIASVNLTQGMLITKSDIEQIIKNNQSFTQKEKDRLINGLPELPIYDQDIIHSGNDMLSLVELLSKELEKQLPGSTVQVSSTKSLQLMLLLKNPSVGLDMPLYIQDARIISSLIPQGLHFLPEGAIILVHNGIAGILTPAPKDAVDTLLSADALLNLDTIFGSAKKEIFDAKVDNNGTLNLKFKDGSKFSGSFGYATVKEGDGNFDAGTSSFELHGTDPASEAYSVLVVYNDGYTQQLSPSVSALEQLVQVLDTLAAGSYTLDRETGIFTVLGARFKPSYLIDNITPNDEIWFRANKDSYGIAWETGDYNGDGAVDLKMWTVDGKQVIYTVIQ